MIINTKSRISYVTRRAPGQQPIMMVVFCLIESLFGRQETATRTYCEQLVTSQASQSIYRKRGKCHTENVIIVDKTKRKLCHEMIFVSRFIVKVNQVIQNQNCIGLHGFEYFCMLLSSVLCEWRRNLFSPINTIICDVCVRLSRIRGIGYKCGS